MFAVFNCELPRRDSSLVFVLLLSYLEPTAETSPKTHQHTALTNRSPLSLPESSSTTAPRHVFANWGWWLPRPATAAIPATTATATTTTTTAAATARLPTPDRSATNRLRRIPANRLWCSTAPAPAYASSVHRLPWGRSSAAPATSNRLPRRAAATIPADRSPTAVHGVSATTIWVFGAEHECSPADAADSVAVSEAAAAATDYYPYPAVDCSPAPESEGYKDPECEVVVHHRAGSDEV